MEKKLLRPLPVSIILELENKPCHMEKMKRILKYGAGSSFITIRDEFIRLNLAVRIQQDGRSQLIILTEKGKALAEKIRKIIELSSGRKIPVKPKEGVHQYPLDDISSILGQMVAPFQPRRN